MNKKDIEIQELKEKLLLSEKRYEIAVSFSDMTVFDYNVITKKIQTQHTDFELFGMPGVMENGIEDAISTGIISQRSHEEIRNLYKKIDSGVSSARAIIYANSLNGSERIIELFLVNIFNEKGIPIHAVGVRKDITDTVLLKKEKKYNDMILSDWVFIYEADITQNTIIRYDSQWLSEIGLSDISSFSDMIQIVIKKAIDPEFVDLVEATVSKDNILKNFEDGKSIITFEYRKKTLNDPYMWFRQTINIIKEEVAGDINVRSYIKNINHEKEKEIKALEERYYYESMVSKTDALYEFNLSKNIITGGQGDWGKQFDLTKTNNYAETMKTICENIIHPLDREEFKSCYFYENILDLYNQGKREITCEYRRPNVNGKFIWVSSTLHLFEDLNTTDIKGYNYIHSIDTQKKEQLDLLFKSQIDSLTGLYNKATLEDKISEFISFNSAKKGTHVFFILDLDYFKIINDNFGHAFGDVLLSQTAGKIRSLFREDDILGRIGGDEFVVFMKNIQNDKDISSKASEICLALEETFTQNGVVHKISMSIGAAIYSIDGKDYQTLYHNSDTALYYAKEHGRNQYAIYNDTMRFGATNIKDIDNNTIFHRNIFRENISEYVFRILYETNDKGVAINTILELIGKNYNTNRVYIFENSYDGNFTRNTFEWCSEGITPQKDKLQGVYIPIYNYEKNFNDDGYFYMPDIEKESPELKAILSPQGIKSMLQFSIIKNGVFVGFIGFDQCDHLRFPTQSEISECRNMANVIGIFITEMRAIERAVVAKSESDVARLQSEASKQLVLSIVNALDSYAYVCDNKTHKVLFINEKLNNLLPNVKIGDICYKSFWANETICKNCPMKVLIESGNSNYITEMFNTHLNIWIKVTTSWIDWLDGQKACLVDSVDITKYIKDSTVYDNIDII